MIVYCLILQGPFKHCLHLLNLSNVTCVQAQLHLTLWNPMDCSPPGSSVHGICQSRILVWVAISYSRGIFLTQGLNLRIVHLFHWQADSLPLCHVGSTSSLFIHAPILFSRLWIIFTIITLNSFLGRLPISFSFLHCEFLPHFFICWVCLCLFILFNLLCLGFLSTAWKVVVPLNCRVCLPWMRLDQFLVKFPGWVGSVPMF